LLGTFISKKKLKRPLLPNASKNQGLNPWLIYFNCRLWIQMLKKMWPSIAIVKNLNSFVPHSRQGVQFNKQFVDKTRQTKD
jgi:hypothetical protein